MLKQPLNAIAVIMPQLGESVVEGTLTKWLKTVGEPVKEFEPLLEINTDKVDTEVPSPTSGILLEILASEGTVVQAGVALAWIGTGEQSFRPTQDEPSDAHPSKPPIATTAAVNEAISGSDSNRPYPTTAPPSPGRNAELGFISPLVSQIARQHDIDLHQVIGSGLGGRITKQDVLKFLERKATELQSMQATGQSGAMAVGPRETQPISYPPYTFPGDELRPLSLVRRTIAEHMVFSERTAPHVTTVMEADLSKIIAHRQANKEGFAQDGANLTLTAYFASAAVAALKAYPLVNSSWSEQGILIHHVINLGIAASLGEAGLIVPVLHNADGLSLLGLARAINDLAGRARSRQLKPDEVRGGTFTITNHGTTGSLFAAPIINQPQCAILGVGVIQKRVMVITDVSGNDALAIRPMVYLSLTFDHRILDGALADQFLSEVVKSLENYT